MSLTSFLFERHQIITHRMHERLSTWRGQCVRRAARSESRPVLCDPLEPRMLMSASHSLFAASMMCSDNLVVAADIAGGGIQSPLTGGLGVTVGATGVVTAATPYTYVDSSGNTVTWKLSGPGSVQVTLDDAAAAAHVELALTGTTLASALSVTVTNAGNPASAKITTIQKITLGDGSLGALHAGSADLLQGGSIAGVSNSTIRTIALHDVKSGATIEIKGPLGGVMNFSARDIENSTKILLDGMVSGGINFTARAVLDGAAFSFSNAVVNNMTLANVQHASIKGLIINSLNVTGVKGDSTLVGNFSSSLELTGITGKAVTLGSATIAGTMRECGWTITGKTGAVSVGAFAACGLNVTGDIGGLNVAGDLSQFTLNAAAVGTMNVGGFAYNANMTLDGGSMDSGDLALKSLTVGDSLGKPSGMTMTITINHGSVGTIKANTIGGFVLNLGDGAIDKILVAHDMSDSHIQALKINTVDVKGNIANSTTFSLGSAAYDGKTVLGSLTAGGSMNISQLVASYGNVGTIKASAILELRLSLNINAAHAPTLGKLQVAHDAANLSITAGMMGALDIGGNLSNAVVVLGTTASEGKTLFNSFKVGGNVSTTTLANSLHGNFGTITVGSVTSTAQGNVTIACGGGSISSITSNGAMDMTSGTFMAGSIRSWTVTGDLIGLSGTIGASGNVGKIVLNTLTVTGDIKNSQFNNGGGNLNVITARNMSSVGFNFANCTINRVAVSGNQTGGGFNVGILNTWTVGGNLDQVTAHVGQINGKNGKTMLGSLSVKGSISGLTLAAENSTAGNIGTIQAGSITGSSITTNAGTVNAITLTNNTKLNNTGNWAFTDLRANCVKTIKVGGAMSESELNFGTSSAKTGVQSLTSMSVAGDVYKCDIISGYGDIGAISMGSMSNGSIDVHQRINTLKVAGDMLSTTPGSVDVTAKTIGNWAVGGNMAHVYATLGTTGTATMSPTSKRVQVLDNLTVAGRMEQTTVSTQGSIGTIKAKRMNNNNILAGYSGSSFISLETIGSVIVTGDKAFATSSVYSTLINALNIGAMTLTYPGNSSQAVSVNSMAIHSLKIVRLNGSKVVTTPYNNLDHADQATFIETGVELTLLDKIVLS